MIRWPGQDRGRLGLQRDHQHHDWLPTFLAAAGEPDIIEKLKKGHKADGQDVQGPHRRLQPAAVPDRRGRTRARGAASSTSPTTATCVGAALRELEGRVHGAALPGHAADLGRAVHRRCGCRKLFNLRTDPFERADITSNTYYDWLLHHDYFIVYTTAMATSSSRRSRSSRRGTKPASFSVDQVMAKMEAALQGGH